MVEAPVGLTTSTRASVGSTRVPLAVLLNVPVVVTASPTVYRFGGFCPVKALLRC